GITGSPRFLHAGLRIVSSQGGAIWLISHDVRWHSSPRRFYHLFMLAQFLCFFLAIVAIAPAVGLIASRNPVASATRPVSHLFCVAGLYLTMNAAFIGVIQVLVYAGAIMVLFLFVIMLLNLSELPAPQSIDWKLGVAFVVAMVGLAQLVYVVARGLDLLPVP